MCDVHLCYRNFIETTCIDNLPMSPTSIGRVAAMLRIFGSVSNLPLLTIGDYYYHSYGKMVNEKWRPGWDMVWVLVGVRCCVPQPMGHSLVTLFSLSVSVKDQSLHWILVRSHTYYPEHILVYGSREGSLLSCREFWLFPDRLIGDGKRWRSKHHIETGSQVWGLGV